jgi:hypothetical protein
MQYKTITLELLAQQPRLYHQLQASRTLRLTLDRLATVLRDCHQSWIGRLARTRPGSHPAQLASEALELAIQELQEDLQRASAREDTAAETLSLDAAMAFLLRHTPPAS